LSVKEHETRLTFQEHDDDDDDGTADKLTQEIFNFPARRQTAVKCKMMFTSQQRSGRAGQNDQVFCKWPPRSPDLTVCDAFPLGVREGQSLCTSTTRNRG